MLATSRARALVNWRHVHFIDARRAASNGVVDISKLLAETSWSVASLLPSQDDGKSPTITAKQLHHLLRLSALPPPKDATEQDKMLKTLSSQLHFVKAIQSVDTTGVETLASLRDETAAGKKESELGLDALKDALAQEEIVGQHHKRIRRKRASGATPDFERWDVLGNAEKRVGRFFVVESGKD